MSPIALTVLSPTGCAEEALREILNFCGGNCPNAAASHDRMRQFLRTIIREVAEECAMMAEQLPTDLELYDDAQPDYIADLIAERIRQITDERTATRLLP